MDLQDQFTSVIKENKGLIFKVAAMYTNSPDDRNDLQQEIVYQLWKSFGSFKQDSKLSTWMYRVALNTAISYLRQTKRRVSTIPLELDADRLAEDYDKTEEEQIQQMYAQIQMLHLLDRGIILLFLEGKKYEEIASIIGITPSNVGTRISRIKEKLRTQLVKQP
ncbi:RNA polymerase sigma factor [Rufibacter glacialis]|uniref:RNA polymerase sigma factor n=1 Tax=Rufibacter glacialis TaxID=1259555 RepID=A0A5M8QM45_9BACT|nr:sigma-70 family RNA polymerase sigma factor [Rufibacter glacialis]KAA6435302.1 sigma-70 family RNA polymerase sigma factor [Rufibacter glacialis]GGK62163.1 DNA-directed RNA polymerase sigma-70 factor [Rufibacter glacialis]